jgi:hypothetical protein
MEKFCKFYVKGNCKEQNCKFKHIDNICSENFFGNCTNNDCQLIHKYKLNKNKKHKKFVNTENYEPSFKPHDMVVKLILNKDDTNSLSERDVFLCPNIFTNNDYYNTLLQEIKNIGKNDILKLWHGDTHYIVDDHINWKQLCPKFTEIINILKEYFGIDVKATRFNLYENSNHFKPYHFDAAAFDEEKAKIQNITIGVSFGATRDIAFESIKDKTVVSIPLLNCTAYAFAKDININWKHGVPQVHPDKAFNKGRISIIAWGKVL